MTPPVYAPEFQLLAYTKSLGEKLNHQQAAIFNLSRTDPVTKKDNAKFEKLKEAIRRFYGENTSYFLLSNYDLIVIAPDIISPKLGDLISATLNIFGGDSFMATIDRSSYNNLCFTMDMSMGTNEFNNLVLKYYNRLRQSSPSDHSPLVLDMSKAPKHISLKNLADFEQPLVSNDISSVTKRQDICIVNSAMHMRVVMSEVFVSIMQLTEKSIPNANLLENKWLFMHLTSILDNRVLAFLKNHQDRRFQSAISINLNVSSFFTPAFKNFDQMLNPYDRETIMFELQLIDVIANMEDFIIARDALRARGYRFCLDSILYSDLPHINDDIFELDMIKLNASGKFRHLDRNILINTVKRIDEMGSRRFILSRCDDKDTILFGQKMGIRLFQGYFIDHAQKKREIEIVKKMKENISKKSPSVRAHPRAIRPN